MKRIVIATMMMLAALTAGAKNDWKGKVVDQNGDPVAYANVAVLSKADSTVVCGTVTEEDGTFNIVTDEKDGIMMVAILGYRTLYLSPVDGAVITIFEDTAMLEGAAIQAIMPKTKLTGEGLQTNVRGSVLEKVGTANDVLAKTPGIIKTQNGIEVIGKGSPLVYINGRRVTDSSELTRLQSNEIQSVEVITNPGAQYDATVRSVVRKFNDKPAFFAQLLNTLTVKGGWQFELGGLFQSKGYTQNMMLTSPYFDLTAAIQKTLLKDGSLVLRLEGADLARMAHVNVDTDFGNHTLYQTNLMDTQRVKFTLRYSFNSANSKYRGTGAGADTKARM